MNEYPFDEKVYELMLYSWAWFSRPGEIIVRLPEPMGGNGKPWVDPTPPKGLR